MWAYLFALIFGAAGAAYSTWQVQEWRWGNKEVARLVAEQQAETARQLEARQQREAAATAASKHAARVAVLSTQLGDARAHIARLSDRQCLAAGTVRMLNGIGASGLGVRAPAANLAGAPPAPAAPAPDDASSYATERDTADHIATCRASYAAVSDQLNQILDIEDKRHPPGAQ